MDVYYDDEDHWAKVDENGSLVQVSDKKADSKDDRNDPSVIDGFEDVNDG